MLDLRVYLTFFTGSSINLEISSSVGFLPFSSSKPAISFLIFAFKSLECVGTLMLEEFSLIYCKAACLIHQHAYVLNLNPNSGSNLLTAFNNPIVLS